MELKLNLNFDLEVFYLKLIKVNLFDKQIIGTAVKGLDLLCTLIRDKDWYKSCSSAPHSLLLPFSHSPHYFQSK